MSIDIEKNIRKVVISFPLCGVYYDCRLHIQSCLISLSLPNSPKFILFFLLLLLILLPSKIVIKWIHKWKNTFLLQKNRKFKCSSLKKNGFWRETLGDFWEEENTLLLLGWVGLGQKSNRAVCFKAYHKENLFKENIDRKMNEPSKFYYM